MSTHDITASLYALPSSTWTAMWPNRNKASRELAMMLQPLGVEPTVIRFGDETMRGYHRYTLEPLWSDLDVDDVTSVTVTSTCNIESEDDELIEA